MTPSSCPPIRICGSFFDLAPIFNLDGQITVVFVSSPTWNLWIDLHLWTGAADLGRHGRQLPTQYFRIYLVNLAQKFCLKFFIKCLPTQYKNGSAAPAHMVIWGYCTIFPFSAKCAVTPKGRWNFRYCSGPLKNLNLFSIYSTVIPRIRAARRTGTWQYGPLGIIWQGKPGWNFFKKK